MELRNSFLAPTVVGNGAGQVHQGFQAAYLTLRDQLLDRIFEQLGQLGVSREASILVRLTGHSMGGALATLCGYDLRARGWDVCLVTFGTPRVGDHDFASALRRDVPRMARYINKLDMPSCWPANPSDPYDRGDWVRSLIGKVSLPMWKIMQATGYEHACPCVVLDPSTSSALHVMITGLELAELGKDMSELGLVKHILRPHCLWGYVESLDLALDAVEQERWMRLPSVGSWYLPLVEVPEDARKAKQVLDDFSLESQEFLKYGSSLLAAFKGRGPRVLLDLHDNLGSYSKKQLAAMGVEPTRFETPGSHFFLTLKLRKVPLETILRSSPQLLHSDEGRALLRSRKPL